MSTVRTIRFDVAPDAAERAAVEAAARASSGSVQWRDDERTRRAYALVECERDPELPAVGAVFERPVIALAVTPTPPEALSALLHAFGGPGRPAGVTDCVRDGDELLLEWNPDVTPVTLVRALLRAELERFRGAYVARPLAPLPVGTLATVAAQGLQTPGIAPDRILDLLVKASDGVP